MSSIKSKTIGAAALVLLQSFCPVQQNWLPCAFATHDLGNLVAHDVSFTVTSADKRLAESEHRLQWSKDGKFANNKNKNKNKSKVAVDANSITIDCNKRFQKVLGFGGAFTDAACYNFNLMPDEARQKLFTELFAQDQLGLNVCRTCMGSSDYSTKVYSYDDGEVDPQLKRFSIATDKEYILPILRQATKTNPELYLFATPWSPPGWMKAGHSMLGGNMRKEFMSSYANYFVKYLQAYKAEGVTIGAVTVQNEVDTDQDGRMPACSWPQESETDFTVLHLGPALRKADLETKIWLIDHNYNLWGRAIGELETPDVRKFASGIAWHGYLGDVSKMTRVHDAFPDINMYWTEGGPDYTAKNYATDWAKWSQDFTGIFRNWSKSVTAWNLALDEVGKPNLGPFPCGGLVTVDSKTHEVTRSGQYYAIAQFSKFVKRDAVRIDSQSDCAGLQHVAFQNPNGQFVLIVTNSGEPKAVHLVAGGEAAECQLDRDSVTTFVWQ